MLSETVISPGQCRAARGWLGWSQAELAARAGVSRPTIVDFERGARVPHGNNLAAIAGALEEGGVEFPDARTVRLAAGEDHRAREEDAPITEARPRASTRRAAAGKRAASQRSLARLEGAPR